MSLQLNVSSAGWLEMDLLRQVFYFQLVLVYATYRMDTDIGPPWIEHIGQFLQIAVRWHFFS